MRTTTLDCVLVLEFSGFGFEQDNTAPPHYCTLVCTVLTSSNAYSTVESVVAIDCTNCVGCEAVSPRPTKTGRSYYHSTVH
jgi:hypothetical protein